MTEHEWLTSGDPVKMLEWRTHISWSMTHPPTSISSRQLRLFACACTRLHKIDPDIQEAVELAELHADTGDPLKWQMSICVCVPDAAEAARLALEDWIYKHDRPLQATILRDIVGNPFRQHRCMTCRSDAIAYHPDYEKCTDCDFGLWLRWSDFTVPRMAQAIYDERAFERLPVLADALEEAGCDNVEIIEHLRGRERCGPCEVEVGSQRMQVSGTFIQLDGDWGFPKNPKQTPAYLPQCKHCHGSGWRPVRGPHVRGCWVLDLLLGKE